MKTLCAIAVVGLSLIGSMSSAFAQRYGDLYDDDRGRDYRPYYEGRGRDYRYRDDYEYRERPRYRERRVVFSEREYLRCHADVRRAVYRGDFESGFEHYQVHGRREGRQLSC